MLLAEKMSSEKYIDWYSTLRIPHLVLDGLQLDSRICSRIKKF